MSNPCTVTVRVKEADEWGGEDDWGTPFDVSGCIVYPAESTDVDGRGRDGVVAGLTVLTPSGSVIPHGAQVQVPAPHSDPAFWWEVRGEFGAYASPFSGWAPGGQVSLRRGQG